MAVDSTLLKSLREETWRKELRDSMKNKERTALTRVHMKEEDPSVRIRSNVEVNCGLTLEEAMAGRGQTMHRLPNAYVHHRLSG